jgi:hypothetical protein
MLRRSYWEKDAERYAGMTGRLGSSGKLAYAVWRLKL